MHSPTRNNAAIAAIYLLLAEFPAWVFPGASPFWPPAAIATVVALRWRWSAMPGVFAGSLLANLLASRLGPVGALIASVGNVLAPMLGVYLLERLRASTERWWDEPRQVLVYLLAMGLVPSTLSAAIGISGMRATGMLQPGGGVLENWIGWSLGDGSAAVMLAPLLQLLWTRRGTAHAPRSSGERSHLAGSLAVIIGLWGLALLGTLFLGVERTALLGLFLFPLIWSVFSLELVDTFGLLAFTFVLLASSAALGAPIVAASSPYQATVALDCFLLACGGAVMFAASLQSSRRLAMRRLEEQAASLERLARQRARTLVEQDARFRAQLLRLSDMNALRVAIHQAMTHAQDDGALNQRICDLIAELRDVASASLLRPDPLGTFVAVARADAHAAQAAAVDDADTQRVATQVWRQRQAWFSDEGGALDTQVLEAEVPVPVAAGSVAALPLQRAGRPWAVLLLELRFANGFDQALREVAGQLATDISLGLDRLDATRRERELSELNQALLSNMSVGICVSRHPDLALRHVNQRLAEMIGAHDRTQLRRLDLQQMFVADGERERVDELADSVLRGGRGHRADVVLRRLDGEPLVCDISAVRLDFGDGVQRIVWTAIDVTERYRKAEQLRQVSAAKAALLANTVVAIDMVRYPDRAIVEVNQGFIDLFGFASAEQLLGSSTSVLYSDPAQDQRMAELSWKVLREGAGSLSEVAVRRPDGATLYVDVHGRRVDDGESRQPMIVWTAIDVSARRALTQELNRLAMFDALTGLPNRRATEQHISRAIERARRRGTAVAVGMIDLDDFKPINDRFGHDVGDRLLRDLGARLRESMRAGDFVGRLGGDEFVIVLEDLGRDGAGPELDAILARMGGVSAMPFELGQGVHARVGMSLGVAFYPDHSDLPDTLLRLADAAMYRVKGAKPARERWWGTPQG